MVKISKEELDKMHDEAADIRKLLIETVSKNGGHLASNLGIVELTLALFKSFDFSKDLLLFDVGHQSYVYKILTDRKDRFQTLRQRHGIGPFMDPNESPYDNFLSGHAGTALSAGAGLAMAHPDKKVVVIVGDASVANGHSLEALNNIGGKFKNMIIILNDNEMSIGKNVGSISKFFGKFMISERYIGLRDEVKGIIKKVKKANRALNTLERMEVSIKNFFFPLSVLESLGYKYFGTIDGHNIEELVSTFEKAKRMEGPIFIHVKTQKGKGYQFAEKDKEKFHGISPFDLTTGATAIKKKTYSDIFGEEILKLGKKDPDIYLISAGMVKGTGDATFFNEFPQRSVDVGIAEGHAVTFAAGLAKGGKKPYLSLYSTFLQRGFSQLIHDVSLQKLPVRFIIDRAGIVGEDGKTHNGLYDLDIFLTIPNYTVISPTSSQELVEVLEMSVDFNDGPLVIRIPREISNDYKYDTKFELGKWREAGVISNSQSNTKFDNLFISVGSMFKEILDIKDQLEIKNINGMIVSAASLKPMDSEYLLNNINKYKHIFVLEEAYEQNSYGTYILDYINKCNINKHIFKIALTHGSIPHGKRNELLEEEGLKGEKLIERIEEQLYAAK